MNGTTVEQALRVAAGALGAAGIDNARGEARMLVGHALDVPPPQVPMTPDRRFDDAAWRLFQAALDERCRRRPMAQVLGHREFWSLDFAVTADTLDPRPDSETVIEAALDGFPDRNAAIRVLDLGVGTGCLLLSVLSEFPNATGIGIDLSPRAAAVARRNARSLGLADRAAFCAGRWADSLATRFDLVLSNPPYIASGDIAGLAPEVSKFEPRLALDGGPDGLDSYRAIAAQLPDLLVSGGLAVLEIGWNQGESVSALMRDQGLEISAIRRDLAGAQRCLALNMAPLRGC